MCPINNQRRAKKVKRPKELEKQENFTNKTNFKTIEI